MSEEKKPEVKKIEEEKKQPKEVKKEAPKRKPSKVVNEHLFRKGDELELKGEVFVVKQIGGIDIILSRKDFK